MPNAGRFRGSKGQQLNINRTVWYSSEIYNWKSTVFWKWETEGHSDWKFKVTD